MLFTGACVAPCRTAKKLPLLPTESSAPLVTLYSPPFHSPLSARPTVGWPATLLANARPAARLGTYCTPEPAALVLNSLLRSPLSAAASLAGASTTVWPAWMAATARAASSV